MASMAEANLGVISRPSPVNLRTGNIHQSWEEFKQKFGFFLKGLGMSKAASDVKFGLLMGEAGPDALDVYNSFRLKLIKKKKMQMVSKKSRKTSRKTMRQLLPISITML